MGGGFRRLLSPAARRRRNPNPSPPSWGGAAGRSPQGGAPFLCRPGQALPRAAGRAPPPFSAPGRRRKPGLAAARDQPKENHGRAPDRGPPPPRRPGDGGAPPGGGRIRRRRGTGAGQAANPTPRRPQPAAGPPPPRQSAPGGGVSPPGFRAASNETGRRPTTGRGPRRQPPANTNGGEGPRAGAGQGRARCDWGGGGRAGPVPARPAPDRPHTFYVCPSGANSAAGARAPNRDGGAAGLAPGGLAARAAGGTDRSRGHPSRSWGGVAAKKCREACPPAGQRLDEKKCGEDALSPPLAVTADTRYPPVRRSSPKRTRCRPVPYALAVRRLLGLRSCVP